MFVRFNHFCGRSYNRSIAEFSTQCNLVFHNCERKETERENCKPMVSTTEDAHLRNRGTRRVQFSPEDPIAHNGTNIDILKFNIIPKLLSPEYVLIIPSKIQAHPETYLRSRFPNTFSQLRLDSHLPSVFGNAFKHRVRQKNVHTL